MVKSPLFFRVMSISGQGMIVDLEYNLRRALDRRKQRSYVVPPSGQKCVQCGRETSYRAWQLGVSWRFHCGEMDPSGGMDHRSTLWLFNIAMEKCMEK